MSTLELRQLAKERIDALPATRLRSVLDFIGYLSSGSSPARPDFATRITQAKRDIAAGRLTAAAKLRRKY